MKIIVSAGGTGGHLYPALALVEYIESIEPDTKFLFVGTTDRLESKVVPQRGYDYVGLNVKGLVGNPLQKLKNALIFVKSLSHSKRILKEFKPDVVIGFGGYPSASIVKAAQMCGIKTIIHEQNSIIGLTNKILIKKVDKIVCCYEHAYQQFPKEKTYLLGNPRASAITSNTNLKDVHDMYNLDKDKKVIVIVMGSLGSKTVNSVVSEALLNYRADNTEVLFVTGNNDYERISDDMKEAPNNIHVIPYIEDMCSVLSSSDLVVSRAGATTLAEITAIGVASIIIPSPYVVLNHQEYNARELSQKDACELLLEKDLTAEKFNQLLNDLITDNERLKTLQRNSKALGKPNACKDIYNLILELVGRK